MLGCPSPRFAVPAGERDLHGAARVAEETLKYRDVARFARLIQVDGEGGIVVAPAGQVRTVIRCTLKGHRIAAMEVIADPEHLRRLNLSVFPD